MALALVALGPAMAAKGKGGKSGKGSGPYNFCHRVCFPVPTMKSLKCLGLLIQASHHSYLCSRPRSDMQMLQQLMLLVRIERKSQLGHSPEYTHPTNMRFHIHRFCSLSEIHQPPSCSRDNFCFVAYSCAFDQQNYTSVLSQAEFFRVRWTCASAHCSHLLRVCGSGVGSSGSGSGSGAVDDSASGSGSAPGDKIDGTVDTVVSPGKSAKSAKSAKAAKEAKVAKVADPLAPKGKKSGSAAGLVSAM
jgi:hypothetical protein